MWSVKVAFSDTYSAVATSFQISMWIEDQKICSIIHIQILALQPVTKFEFWGFGSFRELQYTLPSFYSIFYEVIYVLWISKSPDNTVGRSSQCHA